MSKPTIYTTIQGETWDQIALKVYGRETAMHHLIAANPAQRLTLFFEAGVELAVPAIAEEREIEIPRWKER